MTQALENNFVKPLVEFYGRNPFAKGFSARLEPYAKDLSGEVLESVATRLIEKHKAFPSFAQCKAALTVSAASANSPLSTATRAWDTKAQDLERWRARQEAVKICRCQLGHDADRDGWLCDLIDFAQDVGRLPTGHEIERCKQTSQKSRDGLARLEGTPLYRSVVGFRENMLERARRDVFP